MDSSLQPDDLAQLREQFPDWDIEARWTVAGTGPDSRYLLASRGGVTVSAWTAADLTAEISGRPTPGDAGLVQRGNVLPRDPSLLHSLGRSGV